MSSGTLPMATYHRTQALGAGSFGSVLTVYNDDGEEFAMKLFEPDDDDDDDDDEFENKDTTLELGALLEISVLRLLRDQNAHTNIVEMADVRGAEGDAEEDEENIGAGTSGCLGMAMPLYPLGSLDAAIDKKAFQLQSRPAKIRVAHGLLSALTYLHENGIMHRDIKSENVMLVEESDGSIKPVLIDFSLAKIVNATMLGDASNWFPPLSSDGDEDEPTANTGQAGTLTYMAPEVNECEPYGLRSDLWSLGVVFLEMLRKEGTLQAVKATQAEKLVQEGLQSLPEGKPFPNLVRSLLKRNPEERWMARECIENMSQTLFSVIQEPILPPKKIINIKDALPFDDIAEDSDENVAPPSQAATDNGKGKKKKNFKKKDPVLDRRLKNVRRLCNELECDHPMTIHAAMCYCQQMLQLEEELDDLSKSQMMLDCVLVAHKMFEVEMLDLTELEENYKSFKDWDLSEYKDNEATILMMLDYCLFPRELVDLS